ncbi:MAG: hypothetical protein RL150_125 [Candidatus Parcubacteria bacterium]|jgi:hypothetical protein
MDYLQTLTRIFVVDDKPENRAAARAALTDMAPNAMVTEFSNAAEIIAALCEPSPENPLPDFIFSDMCMEDQLSGWSVAVAGGAWSIPVNVVSGGHQGHGGDSVMLGYPNELITGSKADPDLWRTVITMTFAGDHISNALLMMLKLGKRDTPDETLGQTIALTVAGFISLAQERLDT